MARTNVEAERIARSAEAAIQRLLSDHLDERQRVDELREVVAWINGGFVAGERRQTYADPNDFLDEIKRRTDAVLASTARAQQDAGETS